MNHTIYLYPSTCITLIIQAAQAQTNKQTNKQKHMYYMYLITKSNYPKKNGKHKRLILSLLALALNVKKCFLYVKRFLFWLANFDTDVKDGFTSSSSSSSSSSSLSLSLICFFLFVGLIFF